MLSSSMFLPPPADEIIDITPPSPEREAEDTAVLSTFEEKAANAHEDTSNLIRSARKKMLAEVGINKIVISHPSRVTTDLKRRLFQLLERDMLCMKYHTRPFLKHIYEGRLSGRDEIRRFEQLTHSYHKVLCERLNFVLVQAWYNDEMIQSFLSRSNIDALFEVLNADHEILRRQVSRVLVTMYKRNKQLRGDIINIMQWRLIDFNDGVETSPTSVDPMLRFLKEIPTISLSSVMPFLPNLYHKVVLVLLKKLHTSYWKSLLQLILCFLWYCPDYWQDTMKRLIKFWPKTDLETESLFIEMFKALVRSMPMKYFAENRSQIMEMTGRLVKGPISRTYLRGLVLLDDARFLWKVHPYIEYDLPWLENYLRTYKCYSEDVQSLCEVLHESLFQKSETEE